jgi:hypothetical protein
MKGRVTTTRQTRNQAMNDPPRTRPNRHSDEAKARTADTLRNDHARWKEHDQPDEPRGGRPDPERDYPDAGVGSPGKRKRN